LEGRRIGVVTGTAMAALLPPVLDDLATATRGQFDVVALSNSLFGPSVTTAGLLPGRAIGEALAARTDLHLALVPAEAVNDDLLFVDDVTAEGLAASVPMPIRLSYDFVDALEELGRSPRWTVGRPG
jgi:NifB/MoaA-like Fe-S oxidoreductase